MSASLKSAMNGTLTSLMSCLIGYKPTASIRGLFTLIAATYFRKPRQIWNDCCSRFCWSLSDEIGLDMSRLKTRLVSFFHASFRILFWNSFCILKNPLLLLIGLLACLETKALQI